uniref:hypothetical protein n=1 Tax=Escherichia coli TaxID=562 RepID=UPI0009431FE6
MTVSIVSPSAAAVKPRRHPRFRREDIPAPEIDPVFSRGRGVHTPAMKNTAFGQVLALFVVAAGPCSLPA